MHSPDAEASVTNEEVFKLVHISMASSGATLTFGVDENGSSYWCYGALKSSGHRDFIWALTDFLQDFKRSPSAMADAANDWIKEKKRECHQK